MVTKRGSRTFGRIMLVAPSAHTREDPRCALGTRHENKPANPASESARHMTEVPHERKSSTAPRRPSVTKHLAWCQDADPASIAQVRPSLLAVTGRAGGARRSQCQGL